MASERERVCQDDDVSCENDSASTTIESPMETESEVESEMKPSSSLQMMLSTIADERNKGGFIGPRILSDRDPDELCLALVRMKEQAESEDFVMVQRNSFWVALFKKHFLEAAEDTVRDDMLFYVRKTAEKATFNIPKTKIEVYRKVSKKQPSLGDPEIDWEETVYLNLILQQFEYEVTCAVCSRTGDKELQILKKFTQKVYASPSRRQMDGKGTAEEITYPNIFFTVDNFEEAFCDVIVRDSEMVCVELVARDRHGAFQGVIFLGSIRYEALKTVYDTRASLSSRMAQRMSFGGWFANQKRVEFVRMRGPQGKGHAEMAISRVKGTGQDTPDQTPSTENFQIEDFNTYGKDNVFNQRRMSDPSNSWNVFVRGSFRRSGMRKSRSETENVDFIGPNGCAEVEAINIQDEFDETYDHYNGFWGRSFGQAWGWFKEHKRASSVALHSYLTYVTLPWHRIIADVLEVKQDPLLSFS